MKQTTTSIKRYRLPFLSGVEALSGRFITNDFRRHIHQAYIIGIITQGKRVITCPEGSIEVSENELFAINPGQVHACSTSTPGGHSYKVLSLSPQSLQSIASQISGEPEEIPCFETMHLRSHLLAKEFLLLFDLLEKQGPDLEIESRLYEWIARFLASFSNLPPLRQGTCPEKEAIIRARHHMDRHFSQNISLRELADIACLSPFHFQREFKKTFGITPHEYLSDRRITHSRHMLATSDNLADIALRSGFYDQSHFSRVFKKTVGIPPGLYVRINTIS